MYVFIYIFPGSEYDQRNIRLVFHFAHFLCVCVCIPRVYFADTFRYFQYEFLYASKPLIGFCLANLRALFFLRWLESIFLLVFRRNRKSSVYLLLCTDLKESLSFFSAANIYVLLLLMFGFFISSSCWAILTQVWRFTSTKRFYGHYTCFIVVHFATAFFFLLIREADVCLVIFNALRSLIWLLYWILFQLYVVCGSAQKAPCKNSLFLFYWVERLSEIDKEKSVYIICALVVQ